MKVNKRSYIWPVLIAAGMILSACSRDPNVLKQRHFAKGEAYFQRGEYPEAAIEFQNAIQIDSFYSQAHYELAQVYLKQGDWRRGYQELMTTVEISPDDLKAQLALADLLLTAGKIPDARTHAEIVLQKRAAKRASADHHFPRGRRSGRSRQGFDGSASRRFKWIRIVRRPF